MNSSAQFSAVRAELFKATRGSKLCCEKQDMSKFV
jgi:hypothetical protein